MAHESANIPDEQWKKMSKAEKQAVLDRGHEETMRAGVKVAPVQPPQPTVGTYVGETTMSALEERKKRLKEASQ